MSLTFRIMTRHLGSSATFLTYAALGVPTLFFVLARVPETKEKTLEEISGLWR